jgi:uncharacterized protein (DUF1800 family)
MGKIDRRAFFDELVATDAPKNGISEDLIFSKYANHSLPKNLAKVTGTLNQYTGNWTKAEVIHLLRRTTFGPSPANIQTMLALNPSDAVDLLFTNVPPNPPPPPLNNYYNGGYVDPTGVQPETTWVLATYGDGTVNAKRRNSLKSWWLSLIMNQNLSILEKMVFFWHNHFSTETSTIGDARIAYVHHSMLRANALGDVKTLVTLVTKDPGMLIYLNGSSNTATAPDENYGRELQELFTVSKYNNPNYIEDDVKAAAKVLTGWQVNQATTPVSSKFTPSRHSTVNKQFSSFYGNTVITGQTGAAGANETDALITMIFTQTAPQVANWICTKLYRYFVYYDTVTDPTIQSQIISPLASALIANNWNIVPVLKMLLKSQHFFDSMSRGCYIRTPLDYFAGLFKGMGVTLPTSFDTNKKYNVWATLRQYIADNGLDLGDPPNVAGFPAYYQTPEFYELWINSNTYPKRQQFIDVMLGTGFTAGNGAANAIKFDVLAFANAFPDVSDPVLLVQYCCDLFLGIDPSQTRKDSLKSILLSGQTNNSYWTQAWNNYLTTPNPTNTGIVKTRLNGLLSDIMKSAEHHLA